LKLLGSDKKLGFGDDEYLLFSGIGKPEMLLKDATEYMGRAPAEFMIFKDHHSYSGLDVELIRKRAAAVNVKRIICTPKDAVKLSRLNCEDFYVIDLELEFKESIFLMDQMNAVSISGGRWICYGNFLNNNDRVFLEQRINPFSLRDEITNKSAERCIIRI